MSAPRVLLSQEKLHELLGERPAGMSLVEIEDEDQWQHYSGDDLPRGDLKPDHLAYIIYTSGSTGRLRA